MKFKTWVGMALCLVSTIASSAPSVVLTQSSSQVPVARKTFACTDGAVARQNSFWRAYDLAPLGLAGPLSITMVEFAVEVARAGSDGASQPVTVNVYTSAGAFPGGALTLQASQLVNLANQELTKVQVPLVLPTVPLPVNSIVVLELAAPDGTATRNQFFPGSNDSGETGPSYISAAACGAPAPRTYASLGLSTQLILNATGVVSRTLPENLACAAGAIASLPPESLAPAAAKSKTTLLGLVNTATTYQAGRYWSLSLAAVRSALVRTDGCALRGTPDTAADIDLVTSCPAQAPIYACLKGAETQLTTPVPGK